MPYIIPDTLYKRLLGLCETDCSNYEAKVAQSLLKSRCITTHIDAAHLNRMQLAVPLTKFITYEY